MPVLAPLRSPLCLLCLLAFLGACGSTPERGTPAPVVGSPEPRGSAATPAEAEQRPVAAALYEQYDAWRGTPYRYGGQGRNGIDCSAFVQLTFRQQFNRRLPRTTAEQVRLGQAVRRDAIRSGDLVFFRTGRKGRHVGIYVANGRFLHASTSEGVILSRLDDPFWSAHYWQTRRLTDTVAVR